MDSGARYYSIIIIIIIILSAFVAWHRGGEDGTAIRTSSVTSRVDTVAGALANVSAMGEVYGRWSELVDLILDYASHGPRQGVIGYGVPGYVPEYGLLSETPVKAGYTTAATAGTEPAGQIYQGNFQVRGVLEGDIAAFNGTHLLVARGGFLRLYNVSDPRAITLVKSISIRGLAEELAPNATITLMVDGKSIMYRLPLDVLSVRLMMTDNRIIAIISVAYSGVDFNLLHSNGTLEFYPVKTIVAVMDAGMNPVGSVIVDGRLVDTRLTGDTVSLVAREEAYVKYRTGVYAVIPTVNGRLLEPERVVVLGNSTMHYTLVAAINSTDASYNAMALLGSADNIVAVLSADSTLYLACSNLIVPRGEAGSGHNTRLYALRLRPDRIELTGTTTVPGIVDNSWQLEPYRGYLLVLTEPLWLSGSVSLYVLNGTSLSNVSSLRDLALDEKVYGVRLIGDTLYFVTYRRVDPLFAVNLSNPAEPVVIGYLKGPGFDSYLHPVGDDLLLGVGVDDRGFVRLSLYKVDGGRLVLVDRLETKYWDSPVLHSWEQGYKAFTYVDRYGIIVFPAWSRGSDGHVYYKPVVFAVEDGPRLAYLGELNHVGGVRSYYNGDVLYTVSLGVTPYYVMLDTGTSDNAGEIPTVASWSLETLDLLSEAP